jgi:cellulose biosynthesis protein BcsQ
MKNRPVFFNQVLPKLALLLSEQTYPNNIQPLVIRDIHGKIRVAINLSRSECEGTFLELNHRLSALGVYCDATPKRISYRDDFYNPDSIFNSAEILAWCAPDSNESLRVLDRQVTGQDWLIPKENSDSSPPRLVFFGIKGGVGHSTALTMLAYKLANMGKKVLLIDLDLESPGLSGLLLPTEHLADFGVVDWLIEDALGQGDEVLRRMISVSPLSETTQGQIRVAAAAGLDDLSYLEKLSRVYGDVAIDKQTESFTKRIHRLVNKLEVQEQPDVVLIDSRAGLHDLAALSIVGLATIAFLFATDTSQSWQGYKLLFSHWQSHPEVAAKVREQLTVVQALAPEGDVSKRREAFLEKSYTLFSETLYQEIAPNETGDAFNFDLKDESAPHYPLRINWSNRFQEFNPLLLDQGLFGEAEIEAVFGDFFAGALQYIEGNR